jgi:hypothetical protein
MKVLTFLYSMADCSKTNYHLRCDTADENHCHPLLEELHHNRDLKMIDDHCKVEQEHHQDQD